MPTINSPLYWRLSGFYLLYFGSLGALVPYWSLYLKSLGFSAAEIGELLAVIMATKIIAPNIWGWIADHSGNRMRIVRAGSLMAAIAFVGVFYAQSYAWMMLVMFLFSFFWNATLPQFEANTLSHLGERTERYGNIRLWGSIGFIIAVVVLGDLLEVKGAGVLPGVMLLMLIGIWGASLFAPERTIEPRSLEHVSLVSVLKRREVIGLIIVCFLLQASHGPYYAFYSIYMEGHGYSRSLIGLLWALGVVAEIGIFMLMSHLSRRFSLRVLLVAALVFSAFRWMMVGSFAESFVLMVSAQLLHAASFGLYHAVAIQYFHQFFPGRLQGRGQALYSSVSFGAGGAVGALYAGYFWETVGAFTAYATAAGLCLFAALLALKTLPPAVKS